MNNQIWEKLKTPIFSFSDRKMGLGVCIFFTHSLMGQNLKFDFKAKFDKKGVEFLFLNENLYAQLHTDQFS